jgi:hypothetical protein
MLVALLVANLALLGVSILGLAINMGMWAKFWKCFAMTPAERAVEAAEVRYNLFTPV